MKIDPLFVFMNFEKNSTGNHGWKCFSPHFQSDFRDAQFLTEMKNAQNLIELMQIADFAE
jgi:hypothetical protein